MEDITIEEIRAGWVDDATLEEDEKELLASATDEEVAEALALVKGDFEQELRDIRETMVIDATDTLLVELGLRRAHQQAIGA